ncbi:Uncharacterised protein [Salmonella enterica subsp. enterica]|nr:Uncharacterised protein [Salmonella enterica subsp. enterica]
MGYYFTRKLRPLKGPVADGNSVGHVAHILAFTVSGLVATVNLTLREIGVLINESTGATLSGVSSPTPYSG